MRFGSHRIHVRADDVTGPVCCKRGVNLLRDLTVGATVLALTATLACRGQESSPEAALRRYLALPADIDAVIALQTDEASQRAHIRELLVAVFTDPQLTTMQQWLAGLSLQGHQLGDVLASIRPAEAAGPIRRLDDASGGARLRTDITVVETYGLGYNLESVEELFVQYPIGNVSLDAVKREAGGSTDPDAIVFRVTSSQEVNATVVPREGDWRIAEVAVVTRSASLRLSK